MASFKINVSKRQETGKTSDKLAEKGLVPGVIYGKKEETTPITADMQELTKLYHEAGSNHLIDVTIEDGKSVSVLLREIQINPVKNTVRHFDFYALDMTQSIITETPLVAVNDAPAEKEDAVILQLVNKVEVESDPTKIPEYIEIDMSKLEKIGDTITLSELDIPEGVELLTDPEKVVAKADEPRDEEELEALQPDVDEEGEPIEGEEGEEGESEEGESEEGEESDSDTEEEN